MIIKLMKADFSAKNIGILGSYSVLTDLSSGLVYSGPSMVMQGMPLEATISVKDKYTLVPESVVVTMKGVAITKGVTATEESITLNISAVTGDISIVALAIRESFYGNPENWLRQNISGTGGIITENITQSNVMPKEKFAGTASITANTINLQLAWVTYDADGKFKARSSWIKVPMGETTTFSDENPFTVTIATSAKNTSYTVEEMVKSFTIVGVTENEGKIIYSDDETLWVRQNMSPTGGIITSEGVGGSYTKSNIMLTSLAEEPIRITNTSSIPLYTAQITYNDDGSFNARSSWTTLNATQSIKYSSDNPYNIIICSVADSDYSLTEMLSFVTVKTA